MTLTSQQLDTLNQHADAGDRVTYYEAIDSLGDIYDGLALGVVLKDTVAGSSANRYFLAIVGACMTDHDETGRKHRQKSAVTARDTARTLRFGRTDL